MKKRFLFILITVIVACVFTIISCNKKFDEPPPYTPPDLTPTLTIAQLKAHAYIGQYRKYNNR